MCHYLNMQQLVSLVFVKVWLKATQAVRRSRTAPNSVLLKYNVHYVKTLRMLYILQHLVGGFFFLKPLKKRILLHSCFEFHILTGVLVKQTSAQFEAGWRQMCVTRLHVQIRMIKVSFITPC